MMVHTSGRLFLVTMFCVVVAAAPAAAADELGLSRDGTTWSSSIDTPLFGTSIRWVPGDSRTAVFYVRNQGGTPGDLTVDVTSSGPGNLMESEDLRITAKGGGGNWVSVNEPGTRRLLSTPDIADSATVPITVSVAFDADSVNTTQLRSTSLRLNVNLSESASEPIENDGLLGGLLPDTGAPSTWIVGAAALLLGMGAALLRRRDREEVLVDV